MAWGGGMVEEFVQVAQAVGDEGMGEVTVAASFMSWWTGCFAL